ncbi:hypothetical protein LSPH24S_09677 [Lysinibacillus sphaericus]
MIEFEGVVRNVERRFKETTSDYVREQMGEIYGTASLSIL